MPERPQRDRSSARPAPIHIAHRLDTALCDRPGRARCRADTEEAARRRPRPMELAGLEPATSCMPSRQPGHLISSDLQGILCLQRLGSQRRFLRSFRPFPIGPGQRKRLWPDPPSSPERSEGERKPLTRRRDRPGVADTEPAQRPRRGGSGVRWAPTVAALHRRPSVAIQQRGSRVRTEPAISAPDATA
jgi:hypothetical protein